MQGDPGARAIDRRLALLGCLVCQMGLGLGGYVFAVFLKPVVADLGWSRAAFAGAGGPMLLSMALASPLAGMLTERLGARAVFTLGITGVALALVGLSLMEQLWQFYLLGLLLGVSITGLGDIPAGSVVSQWYARGRGLALGLVYIGSNIGGAIVPIAAEAIASRSSWRVALRLLAVVGWVVIVPFALFAVRERGRTPEDPEDDGTPAARGVTLAAAVRRPAFWTMAGVLFAFYFYYLGVNNHLVAFLSDLGFSNAAAARQFSAAVAVGIAGKLGVGLVADRLPARRAAVLTFAVMTAGSFLLLGVGRAPWLLGVFLVVHGVTVAAENVILPLLVAECFGVAHMARIYGALMVALLPGGVGGAVYAGYVFDALGAYWPAFGTFAALNVVAVAALLRLRPIAPR